MSTVLYGIPNCDTVKKARAWLDQRGAGYRFHDFKKLGVPPERLAVWIAELGWEPLVNRKGTTWRGLDAASQASAQDAAGATRLLLAQPSLVKRPVVEWADGAVTVGFDPDAWALRLRGRKSARPRAGYAPSRRLGRGKALLPAARLLAERLRGLYPARVPPRTWAA